MGRSDGQRWLGAWLGAWLVAALVSACASIMGAEEPVLGDPNGAEAGSIDDRPAPTVNASDAGTSDASCTGPGCPCQVSEDCRDPAAPKCAGGKCVACTTEPDSCPKGSYCLPSSQCAPGCKIDAECSELSPTAPFCNPTRHQCIACRTEADCTANNQKCSPAGACVDACTNDGGTCADGKACCGGLCVDTKTDIFNCNGCGSACTGGATLCCGGTCADPLATAAHCGGCGSACSTANAAPTCAAGACTWTCDPGYMHCDTGNTGCETNTASSVTTCGGCKIDCNTRVKNATGIACADGHCDYAACNAGFGDCDGKKGNGCECACGQATQPCCPGDTCEAPSTCETDGGICQ